MQKTENSASPRASPNLRNIKFPPLADQRIINTKNSNISSSKFMYRFSQGELSNIPKVLNTHISNQNLSRPKLFKEESRNNSLTSAGIYQYSDSNKSPVSNENIFDDHYQNIQDMMININSKFENYHSPNAKAYNLKTSKFYKNNVKNLPNPGNIIIVNQPTLILDEQIPSQPESKLESRRSTMNSSVIRYKRESKHLKTSPSQHSIKPVGSPEDDMDYTQANILSNKMLKKQYSDQGVEFKSPLNKQKHPSNNSFPSKNKAKDIRMNKKSLKFKILNDQDHYYQHHPALLFQSPRNIFEDELLEGPKQKEKRKQLEFQIIIAKRTIRSNKLPLRVFITLFRNMKLYYQLIEDALNKNIESMQKYDKNKNQTLISGNLNLLQESFENLLLEVQIYFENNKRRLSSFSNNNPIEFTEIQRQKSISTFPNDRDIESKGKLRAPHEILYSSIQEIILLIDDAIDNRKRCTVFDNQMKKLISLGQQSGNAELQLSSLKKAGRILLEKKDYQGAVPIFKQYKNICHAFGNDVNRLKAYKYLGKCYQNMQKYKGALVYYTKMLQLAWHSNNKDYEILAYDLIGMQYYYIGELEKAQYYHEKMAKGQTEENQSLIQLGIQKIKTHLSPRNHHSTDLINSGYSEALNSLSMKIQSPRMIKIIEEDGIEVSSGDEFELPIPDHESLRKVKEKERLEHDKLFNKKELEDLKKRESERIKSFKVGISKIYHQTKSKCAYHQVEIKSKVKRIQNRNSDHEDITIDRNNTIERGDDIHYNNSSSTTKKIYCETEGSDIYNVHTSRFSLSYNQSSPRQRIFINHLSRNRDLENFNEALPNIGYIHEPVILNDQIDTTTAEKIKKLLEKYRNNLVIIKNGIEAFFHLDNDKFISFFDSKLIQNGRK